MWELTRLSNSHVYFPQLTFFPSWNLLCICLSSRISINLQSECIYIYMHIYSMHYKVIFYFCSWPHRMLGLDSYDPVTAMWPTVTFTTSSSYKPGALDSTSDSWLLNQWCCHQDKADLPAFPSVLFPFLIALRAGLWRCAFWMRCCPYGCAIMILVGHDPSSGDTWLLSSKSLLHPMFAISNGMSQRFLHLFTSHHTVCAVARYCLTLQLCRP